MNGYMLLEKPCPKCFIPLVKKPMRQDTHLVSPTSRLTSCSTQDSTGEFQPRIVTAASLKRIPDKHIHGLPHCVICDTYLVTTKSEMEILVEQKQLLLSSSDNGGEESTLDTRALVELGSNAGSNTTGTSSILFKRSFSTRPKLAGPKHNSHGGIPSSTSTTSSMKGTFYKVLRGKHLTGIAASQDDQGVEMKLDGSSVQTSLADYALPSETPTPDSRDDDLDKISALWKCVGSSSTIPVEPQLALQEVADVEEEGSQTPNLDLLSSLDSSVESVRMQPSPATKKGTALAQQRGNAKTIEAIVENGQQQQEDIEVVDSESGEGDDKMIIVSDSIHYIETEGQEMLLSEKQKHSDEEGANSENEGEECTLTEDHDREEPKEEEESTEETANTGIKLDSSLLPLSKSEDDELKRVLEVERMEVTKAFSSDTDVLLTNLEELYGSKSPSEDILSPTSDEKQLNTITKMQQDIARMLRSVSPNFEALYSTIGVKVGTVEQIDEVPQTTLGRSKSPQHDASKPAFDSKAMRGAIEVVANDLSSILAQENADPTNNEEDFEEMETLPGLDSTLKDALSMDTSRTVTTAASKGSMSDFDDEIMQEYTAR
jgi:hypothetical protein